MNRQNIQEILASMGIEQMPCTAKPFSSEEDGAAYTVWKLEFADSVKVLKKTTRQERAVYETFLLGFDAAPRCFGFYETGDDVYMLMEFVPGQTLSRCTRENLRLALDGLMELQRAWWQEEDQAGVGLSFDRCYESRQKWLPYMADLQPAFEAYLEAFRTVPRTLCNDDLLPFNVLADGQRAVILDWEYGGILPYPCALARLIAYGEEREDALFYMTDADKEFALAYYYDHFIREKGIDLARYRRTMDLFLLKEYAEWVYCAYKSGDLDIPYYQTYYPKALALAAKLRGEKP